MATYSNTSSRHDVPTDAVYRCYVQSTVPKGAGRGDLWLDTSGTPVFKIYDGAAFVSAGGGLANIVEDTTPQLGGDLDVNNNDIIPGVNGRITLKLATVGGGSFLLVRDSANQIVFSVDSAGVVTSDPITGTFDGRVLSVDGAKLDLIEASATADQTDSEIETAYNAQVAAVSQVTAEAGTDTAITRWTAERVKQAIAALESAVYSHPDHTGDVTSTGDGATAIGVDKVVTAKILDANVTLAKLADLVQDRIMGRATASTGAPEAITAQQVLAMINSAATGTLTHERGGIEADISGAAVGDILMAASADTFELHKAAYCIANHTSVVAINDDSAWHVQPLALDLFDPTGMHDTSTNNERIVPIIKGIYLCFAFIQWEFNVNGRRFMRLITEGGSTFGRVTQIESSDGMQVFGIREFDPGSSDYFQLELFQDSGSILDSRKLTWSPFVGCFLLGRT